MKEELKHKLAAEFEAADFFCAVPAEFENFKLEKIFNDVGDKFIYFTYKNVDIHKSLTAYFHEETHEYKVSVKIGLTEFCLTKFFTEDFAHFKEIFTAELERELKKLAAQIDAEEDILIADQKFSAWTYGQNLPKNLAGFELFIAPKNPVRITNGSYIIINYSDFVKNCDFNIFYNVYGDKFNGESQINGVHHPSYIFDADTLSELEKILEENLQSELENMLAVSF